MRRGQEGVNLIERIVLEMGSSWSPRGALDVGIDGYIELFDKDSGASMGVTLAVQSKVEARLASETDQGFVYYCEDRDLEYWLQGNMPVLLIVSRPERGEAFWVSIKDYFADPDRRASRKVQFDKKVNSFTSASYADLLHLSAPKDSGLHLGPIPAEETLYTNLLPIAQFPRRLWMARTDYRRPSELWPVLNDAPHRVGGDWILKEKSVLSFQDLRCEPWSRLCDQGTCEDFDPLEWAETQDPDQKRWFVELLDRTLRDQLYPEVRYWRHGGLQCYAFAGDPEQAPIERRYRALKNISTVTVVAAYPYTNKIGESKVTLRHLAFEGRFLRYEHQWYLEISPTYVFTTDGKRVSRFQQDRLSGIKRREGNRAVLSSVLVWADLLRSDDLFRRRKISFDALETVTLSVGIDDVGWAGQGKDANDEPADSLDLFAGKGI